MPVYYVKTSNDRYLVIKADSFSRGDDTYLFTDSSGENNCAPVTVAHVPSYNVFAVVEEDAFQGDFYFSDHVEDDTFAPVEEPNYASPNFYDAVVSIIHEYLSNDYDPETEDGFCNECPEQQTNAQETIPVPKIEVRVVSGRARCGFVTPEGWVGFNREEVETAKYAAQQYADGHRDWLYTPLDTTTYLGDAYVC